MTKFYLYAADPADLLTGNLNFALQVRTDPPEKFAKYCPDLFICTVDIDLEKHLDNIRINAADVLNQQLTSTKNESEKRCLELQEKIETLTNLVRQPHVVGVA